MPLALALQKLATDPDVTIADAVPPISVHRPLDGDLLRAFDHMVDALVLLDLLGQTGAAGALTTAIALVTAEPGAWANDEMTADLFLERYEAYGQIIKRLRTDPA